MITVQPYFKAERCNFNGLSFTLKAIDNKRKRYYNNRVNLTHA